MEPVTASVPRGLLDVAGDLGRGRALLFHGGGDRGGDLAHLGDRAGDLLDGRHRLLGGLLHRADLCRSDLELF
jgi:hypothetical protein